MGQSAWYQFTTADRGSNNHRYLYGVGLFVSCGVVLVLNITSAEMCASYADREKEDREGPREAAVAETKREGSHDRNHRLAFFSFKHPLHQPPPDLSFTPCRLSSRSKERSWYTFISPFHVGSERMHLGCVSIRGFFFLTLFKVSAPFPVLLADSCSTLRTAFN